MLTFLRWPAFDGPPFELPGGPSHSSVVGSLLAGWRRSRLSILPTRRRTGEGVERASSVLEVRRHLSQVRQLTLLPVRVAVESGSGTNDSS